MCESFLFSSRVSFFVSRGGGRREKKARSRSRAMMKKRALFVRSLRSFRRRRRNDRGRQKFVYVLLSSHTSFFSLSFRFCIDRVLREKRRRWVFFGFSASSDDEEKQISVRSIGGTIAEENAAYFLSSSVARSRNFSSFDRLEFALCTRCLTFLEQEKELLFEVSLPCLQVKHAVEEKNRKMKKARKTAKPLVPVIDEHNDNRLWRLVTDHPDIFDTLIVTKLNDNDVKFFYDVNSESRAR